MPLVIGFAFFIGIVVLVLLGSHLLGPDSWPLASDHEAAKRARATADHAEQLGTARAKAAVANPRSENAFRRETTYWPTLRLRRTICRVTGQRWVSAMLMLPAPVSLGRSASAP
jgi:hypothetical protein